MFNIQNVLTEKAVCINKLTLNSDNRIAILHYKTP